MTSAQIFSIANLTVVPAWLMLVFVPRSRWTRLAACYVVPSVLAMLYLTLLVMNKPPDGAGFGSIEQVERLFSDRWLLLAGWIHYLAFDLFVGAWEADDAARIGLPHWYVVPCLALTFLVGPVGLLLYFAVRAAAGRLRAQPA